MAKPVSFGFSSKPKASSNISTPSTSKPGTPKPILLPTSSGPGHKTYATRPSNKKGLALRDDSEDEDEAPPKHEELTGFGASGAILSKPREEKTERVIENSGNSDWRKRGKNLLPPEVQDARNGTEVVTIERDEVSKAYGLQFAQKDTESGNRKIDDVVMESGNEHTEQQPPGEMTDDERALAALLDDRNGKSKSTAAIAVASNSAWQQRSEADDFRADIATRPESATLDEYAAMPVEEFGMAMLRGMGRKRRANGEIIDLNKNSEEDRKKMKERPTQQGLLGIGAKPVKGLEGVELGAWGKSDMRKNAKGEGFFTPVMIEDKRTGERITEEEFERRKRSAKKGNGGNEDWRERRDRNLEINGRDKARSSIDEQENDRPKKRDRESTREESHVSQSRHDRDRRKDDDRDYDSSRSRRDRSRSRDRRRTGHGESDDYDRNRDKYKDRHRDRYDSSDSRRSEHRNHERDRERQRDRDDRRYRDRR